MQASKPLVISADDVEGQALATMVVNKRRQRGLDGDEVTGANTVKVTLESPTPVSGVGGVAEKVRSLKAGEGLDSTTGPVL